MNGVTLIALKDCSNKFDETRPPPSPLSLWDQRRPAWNQRVINLLNSAIPPWNPSCTRRRHSGNILPYRVVPLWGRHRCNISPFLGHSRPFSFTMLEITLSPNPGFLSYGRGWSYILMGNHVGISIPTIWRAGLSIKTDANEQGVFSHYYFLNDYWSVIQGCVTPPPLPVVNETCEQI